jgi:monoamine oxidase
VTALPYDDGTDRIPGDIVRPVERVLVIGAGMAGLTAANALAHASVPTVVLEARDRIGGRLHTADVGGSPVDLGGSWIHTPVGNPLTAWAEQLGVQCTPADPFDEIMGIDPATGPVPAETLKRLVALAFEDFGEALDKLADDLPPDAPISAAIERFVAGQGHAGLDDVDAGRLRSLVLDAVESDASGPADDIALRGYPTNGLFYEGSEVGNMPLGGYRRLIEPLARGLDIAFDQPVIGVAVRNDGVTATTADGRTHEASHVLVTVPLGVLKAGSVEFDPPLPDRRRTVVERLGFGRFEKVALRFDRPFWTEAGVPHVLSVPADGRAWPVLLLGLDRIVGEPVIVALAFGSRAGVFADVPQDEAVASVLDVLRAAVGGPVPEPQAIARTAWGSEPFTRGAYTYMRPGCTPDDLDELGLPIGGRLLFAGEATGSARAGFADGAFSTGIREAKRLLGQPRVLLGPR